MIKSIFITGSTDGIGKLLALKLAKEGHRVYVHGRDKNKLKALVSEIRLIAKNDNIYGYEADFSDLKAVKSMAAQILKEVSHLDILINNAGIFKSPVERNKNGIDIRFVVNYLAPYLLTRELIPLLQKSLDPRIINLSSAAQLGISFEAMTGTAKVTANESYSMSKLAITMWSFHASRTLKDITVIAVNPGSLLNTKMVSEAFGHHWSPAEKGADILYELAISEKHKAMTGKYFDNDKGRYADAHPDAYDREAIEALIDKTNKII